MLERQLIAPAQDVRALVYGSVEAVQASFGVFSGAGRTHEGWRLSLTDNQGQPVTADELELTLRYDEELLAGLESFESQLQLYQWDAANSTWTTAEVIGRNLEANTITVRTSLLSNLVLGISN